MIIKISTLIALLEEIKDEHGNLEVEVMHPEGYEDCAFGNVTDVAMEWVDDKKVCRISS